jgi:hypothetical protein
MEALLWALLVVTLMRCYDRFAIANGRTKEGVASLVVTLMRCYDRFATSWSYDA